ncbi:MAG: alpha/beta fold hydrolase, partial [Propionibacteriaceae bacterium]|nr:alpha/beta fold hydrolase [Propionibacteriaceae bacterium]
MTTAAVTTVAATTVAATTAAAAPSGPLHAVRLGAGPLRFAFCHGLFGRGRNWTSVARGLLPDASWLVDLPNHGRSPWTARVDYGDMADALTAWLAGLGPGEAAADLTLVGHSMGGQTAMLAALRRPDLVPRLAVVDSAPADIPAGGLA